MMPRQHALARAVTLALAAWVGGQGLALAQAAPPATQPAPTAAPVPAAPDNKVEINAAGSSYDPRRDDTAARIIVNREEILKYGDQTVLDVLRRLPGVTVAGSAVRMRGLAGYTQVLVNGERPPAGFSLDAVAPDLIERIEIVRAATAEFSTQAIAGTINVVLKKSVDRASLEFRGGMGFARQYHSPGGTLTVSDKNGRRSWNFNLYAAGSDYNADSSAFEAGSDAQGKPNLRRDIASHESSHSASVNASGRVNWTLEDGDVVTWQNFLATSRNRSTVAERSTTTLGTARAWANTRDRTADDKTSLRSDLSWVAKLGNSAKLESKIGFAGSRGTTDEHVTGFDRPDLLIGERLEQATTRDARLTTTGKYSRPLFTGHAFAAGWDAGTSSLDTDNVRTEFAWPTVPPQAPPVRTQDDQTYHASIHRLAVYGQDEWTLTPRFSLYLGARWEGVRTRSDGSDFDAISTSTSVFSPLLHALWKLPNTKSDQLRFALTRTYRAPSATQLTPRRTLAINNSATSPDTQGNPHLKPELATGIDIALEHYIGTDGALLSATVSSRSIDQYIHNAVRLVDGRWVVTPSNVGEARTYGVELEAKFPLKTLLADAPAVDLRASVSRHWSSVDAVPGPDNRLDNQTPLSATLGADYKSGRLTSGASFSFSNGGWVRTSLNEWQYKSVSRNLEAYALWKFDARLAVRVAILNVLTGDNTPATLYRDDSGSLYRRTVEPPLLRGRVLLEYKF